VSRADGGAGRRPTDRVFGYVESGDDRLYYELTGEGPPLVLCHGLGGNHAIWWRQIEPLAQRYTVITWDQRGFGNSTSVADDYRMSTARHDLRAIIDHLGVGPVHLLGQSMGGTVALGTALEHPELLQSLIISTSVAGTAQEHVNRLVQAEPARDRMSRRDHPVLDAQFAAENPDLGVLYNLISGFGKRPPPQTVLQELANDRFDPEAIARITLPTLLIAGTRDVHCPPEAMQTVADLIPGARLVALEGSHSLYYEAPEAWNEAVLEFLGALS
jgi:3-oxoadipate enol-lactonase